MHSLADYILIAQDVTNANRNGTINAITKSLGGNAEKVTKRPSILAPKINILQSSQQVKQQSLQQQKQQTSLSAYQYTGKCDNIDDRCKDDVLSATDYVQDMYDLFRKKEKITSVLPVYMEEIQSHINERMRSILVDWLVEVHLKFKLVPETLYLTVGLIDRYLERQEVTRACLQLVGVTCLLIAAKYEEIYPPGVHDLVYICDRAYTRREVNIV